MKQTFQLNLLTFPVWWYTVGLTQLYVWCQRNFRFGVKKSGFALFVRYMYAPLYGDYTRSGRIISFLLRIAILAGKIIALGARLFALGMILFAYLVVLPLSVVMAIYSLIP